MSLRIRWLFLAVAAATLLSIATFDDGGPATNDDRIQALSERFACPECDGQSVSESNAGVAATIRDFIRVQVNEGATDTEIRDQLIASYGSDVLLTPPSDGVSVLIWVLPVVVLVAGSAVVVSSVRRENGERAHATDADIALVEEARRSEP